MKKLISILLLISLTFFTFTVNSFAEEIDEESIIRQKIDSKIETYLEDLGLENRDFVYRIKGNVNDCVIFHGGSNAYSSGFFSQVINGYLITVGGVFSPDNLGWYVFDGENIYTLKEAVDKSIFKMSDVVDIVDAKLLGDVTLDKTINMSDVTELQKYLAGLTDLKDMNYPRHASDVDQNGEVDMYDVVLIQRIIAKL